MQRERQFLCVKKTKTRKKVQGASRGNKSTDFYNIFLKYGIKNCIWRQCESLFRRDAEISRHRLCFLGRVLLVLTTARKLKILRVRVIWGGRAPQKHNNNDDDNDDGEWENSTHSYFKLQIMQVNIRESKQRFIFFFIRIYYFLFE